MSGPAGRAATRRSCGVRDPLMEGSFMSKFKSTVDKRRLVAAVILGAAGALAAGAVTPALAMPVPITGDPMPGMPGMDHGMPMNGMPEAPAPAKPAKGPAAFFTADLTGAQEVPVAGGPAVGAPNGKASAVVEIKGDRVTFGFTWSGISAPTLGHIHEGVTGKNGAVKVGLFTTAIPANIFAISGNVSNVDDSLVKQIQRNPHGFYTNLHTQEFPGGAVRGQLF